jgi:hypothetical protein
MCSGEKMTNQKATTRRTNSLFWALPIVVALGFEPVSQADAQDHIGKNTVFLELSEAGNIRGDRGTAHPNRFDPYLELFEGFAPASQDFILRAFDVGKLTVAPEGQGVAFLNGKLAVNLIRMMHDIETQTRYIETRILPEDGNLPRASDEFSRMLREFPNVAAVLTTVVQRRIAVLEDDVLAVLRDEDAAQLERLGVLQDENDQLDTLNARLSSLLAAIGG